MIDDDQPDDRPRYGLFPTTEALCWNGLTAAQQHSIASSGIVPDRYGGGDCPNRATVAVHVGPHPGPRFYCDECAKEA